MLISPFPQSNGPFELLPVVNEFFQLARLPPGSIRLRSYGGRSLFNGLLSAPAMRKRAGVLDVLNHFPDARFFLVGDSGEQDLELYAEVARARPDQVLAIFVRDAGPRAVPPLDDPTGVAAYTLGLFDGGGSGSGSPGAGTPSSPTTPTGRRAAGRHPARSMSEAPPESPPEPLPLACAAPPELVADAAPGSPATGLGLPPKGQ